MAQPAPSLKTALKVNLGNATAAGAPPTRFLPLVTWSEQSQALSTCSEGLAYLQESRSSARVLFIGAPRNHVVPKSELALQPGMQFNHCVWIWPKAEPLPGSGHDKTIFMYLPAHPDIAGVTRRLLACTLPLATALVLYGMDSMGKPTSIERIAMTASALIELQVPQNLMKLLALITPPTPPAEPEPAPVQDTRPTARNPLSSSPVQGPASLQEALQGPAAAAARAGTPTAPPPSADIATNPEYKQQCAVFANKQMGLIPEILLMDLHPRADFHITFQADTQLAPAPTTPAANNSGSGSGGAGGFASVAVAAIVAAAASAPPSGAKHLTGLLSKDALALLQPPPPPAPPPAPVLPQARLVWRPEPPPPVHKPPPLTGGNWLACMLRAYIQRHQSGIACTMEKCRAAAESFRAFDAIDDALDDYRARMAPAAISAETATAAHADAQAAACKEFLNMVLDVRDSNAVTECYRTLKLKCDEEYQALLSAINSRGPIRLQKGRSSIWGERYSESGGPSGPRSLPTIVQREPRYSVPGERTTSADGPAAPAALAPSASPFYTAQSDLASEPSTPAVSAGPHPASRKPSVSLSGTASQSLAQPRTSYSGVARPVLETVPSYGMADPRPSPSAGSAKLPLVPRRVSLSGNAEAVSKEAVLLDRDGLNTGTLGVLQKQFGSQSSTYLKLQSGPRPSPTGSVGGRYVGMYNSGSSSEKLQLYDGTEGRPLGVLSLGSTGMLPRVGRVSDNGGGKVPSGAVPSGLPKALVKAPSPPRSPQGMARPPPLPSGSGDNSPAPSPRGRLRAAREDAAALPEVRSTEKDPPGLYVSLELDDKLQGLVSKWEGKPPPKEKPPPLPSVLYKLLK